jgi:calcineurin-like phosphoesterase family protein
MTKENLRGRQELIIHGHRHHWTQDTEQRQTIPKNCQLLTIIITQ